VDEEQDVVERDETSSKEEIAEARGMGWADLPEWKGDKSRWVPAKDFLEKGRVMLPVLQKRDREMRAALEAERAERTRLDSELKAVKTALRAIETGRQEEAQERAEDLMGQLKVEISAAAEAGEHTKVVELTEKLVGLKLVQEKGKQQLQTPAERREEQAQIPREQLEWQARNPWFQKDQEKTRAALVAGYALRLENPQMTPAEFYEALDEKLSEPPRKTRVAGSGNGTGSGPAAPRMSAEEREAMNYWGKRVVGPDKQFKTQEEWEKHYIKTLREQERANAS
jgi:hypothetical protein